MQRETRNVSLSTYYRLWGILRQQGWWHQETECALEADTRDGAPAHSYFYPANTRPFVFIDEMNEVWSDGVVVYVDGVPASADDYTVDYINARITFTTAQTHAVTADLAIFDVIVREGYPDDQELLILDLPIVAYQIQSDDKRWFAVGLGLQRKHRDIVISIMVRNEGERQDLTDDIGTYIRFTPLVDYTDHKPLDEKFALDPAFSYADQFVNRLVIQGEIQGDYLQPRPGGSDKEKYRSMIAFEVERIS